MNKKKILGRSELILEDKMKIYDSPTTTTTKMTIRNLGENPV